MGQIQNSLNQIFASTLGMGLAISHSPYKRGQDAIKKAGANITALQEATAQSSSPTAVERELLPDISKAYDAYERAVLEGGTKKQIQSLYSSIEGGEETGYNPNLPYLKYGEIVNWPGSKGIRELYYDTNEGETGMPPALEYWNKDQLTKIKQAMDAKQGVKNAVAERIGLIRDKISQWSNSNPPSPFSEEGAIKNDKKLLKDAEKKAMKDKDFRKPEQLL